MSRPPTFNPAEVEPRWRRRWADLDIGAADPDSPRPKFVIALPPPNITGALHMGHACGFSIDDALCRHHRMLGDEVEWCPGTDHAAIATQNVIERQLADEGTTKEALGRAAFQTRVDAWYEEYGGRIYEQMRRLGYTCDWRRSRFTLDDAYVRAIRVTFKALFDEGLIYRGPRIVNWCPRDRSAISDEEIDWQERRDTLYHLRYPVEGGAFITVATVRPETMLGDTGVAVAPGDARYADLVGRNAVLPIVGRALPIAEDPAVQPEFGTGALKVTPAHDPTDYDIGQRHALPVVSVIAPDGTMDVPTLPMFHGMPAEQARGEVVRVLRELGVVVAEEEYVHDVGHCDRCGHVLEPLISEQWWVRMQTLAEPGIAAGEQGTITFHPQRYTEVYLSWMRNIRDWCISRQIWLGHAIPVSRCANGHRFAWIDMPSSCEVCGSDALQHDPDVLDTWFSSALWPFAIFGWPEDTDALRGFYPTDVLVTARDIIFLWVARMIMTGYKFTGRAPFTRVLITSTIQARDGTRMSKSKGNVVDPLDMTERYGADAVRAWAAAVGTGGQDVRFDEARIASFQRLTNKLWQVTSGVLVGRLGDGDRIEAVPQVDAHALRAEDRWMLAKLARLVRDVDAGFAALRFHEAMERLYDTAWHVFCDYYVEMIKPRLAGDDSTSRKAAAATAVTVLDTVLRLLHPFMPYVTEECAQHLPGDAATLQQRSWPVVEEEWESPTAHHAERQVDDLIDLVQRVRALRQERGVPARDRSRVQVALETVNGGIEASEAGRLVADLVPATVVGDHGTATTADTVVAGSLRAQVVIEAAAASTAHAERQLRELEATITRLASQLGRPEFVERAPRRVVDEARRRLDEATAQADVLRAALGAPP